MCYIASCLCYLFNKRVVAQQLHRSAEPNLAARNLPDPLRQHLRSYRRTPACCNEQTVPQVLVVEERIT
jgi:hypothetical protein